MEQALTDIEAYHQLREIIEINPLNGVPYGNHDQLEFFINRMKQMKGRAVWTENQLKGFRA